jgi:hypothetical protein
MAGSPAPIRLRDVASQSGLKFILENSATPEKQIIETMLGGVAAFDYDGDGWTDIFFANGAAIPSLRKEAPKYFNRLYRNLGGMKFADVTEQAGLAGSGYSMGVAVGDYDNDAHPDLFVAGVRSNHLYRNRGDGTFEDVTRKAGIGGGDWAITGGWFDYDNDGWLDLFVANYLKWSPENPPFCGDAVRGIRAYCHPRVYEGLPNKLYRNRGDGTFEDVSAASGIAAHTGKAMSVAFADYDGDGFLDIFVTNDKIPSFLFRNLGNGTFEEVGLEVGAALPGHGGEVSAMGADFRDYDNDGRPDIVFAALAGETFPLLRNVPQIGFLDWGRRSGLDALTTRRSGWSPALIDLNNDGWKDLFTSNAHVNDTVEAFEATRYKLANSVLAATGGGRFQDVSAEVGPDFQVPGAHRGAAFADFNRDGRLDIVVSVIGEAAQLWENISPEEHSWLVVRLTGTRSNRDGIGAEVRIADQCNHMTSAVGYASSTLTGVHFGLRRTEMVERVEIRWPSGIRQVLTNVPVNQVLHVREP